MLQSSFLPGLVGGKFSSFLQFTPVCKPNTGHDDVSNTEDN